MSDDGKTYTLFLRKGMKWSDGAPFTADDFVFWFEDIYSNKEIVPTADRPTCRPRASRAGWSRSTRPPCSSQFDVPYFLFEDMMAGDTRSAAASRCSSPRNSASAPTARRIT